MIGFLVGCFIGFNLGIITLSCLIISRRSDDDQQDDWRDTDN